MWGALKTPSSAPSEMEPVFVAISCGVESWSYVLVLNRLLDHIVAAESGLMEQGLGFNTKEQHNLTGGSLKRTAIHSL